MGGAGFVRARLAGSWAADAMVMGENDVKERIDLPGGYFIKRGAVRYANGFETAHIVGLDGKDVHFWQDYPTFAAAMNERRSQPRGDIAKLREALEAAQDYIGGLNKLLDGKGCREFDHKKVRWEQALAANEPAQQPAVGEPAAPQPDAEADA